MRSQRSRAVLGPVAAALALVVALVGAPSAVADMDDLRQQQEQNAAEREQVAAALEGTNTELATVYLELQDINNRLPIAEAELVVANSELAAAERERESVQGRLEVAEAQQADLVGEIAAGEMEISSTESAMGEVARSAYRGGSNSMSALSVVLDATSAEEFASQYTVMNSALRVQNSALTDLETLTAINRNRQVRLDAVQQRIDELRVEAEAAVAEAEVARADAEALVAEISQLKADKESRATDLESLKQQYADQQAQLEAENQQIANEIAELAAAEAAERERQRRAAAQASAGGGGGGGSGGGGGGGGGGSSTSSFIPPITRSLYVTSSYGYRVYPITGGWFMHNGVDLRSACGEAQIASASGTVVAVRGARGNGTHGNQVMINHGVIGGHSWVTVYNHLSRFAVSQGQRVGQGQTIGYTGATGNVTGCHVHFEVWKNGSTINPMTLF